MFEILEKYPQLQWLETEVRTVAPVAEHASELHRAVWNYFKSMQELEENPDDQSLRWLMQRYRARIGRESSLLLDAINQLQVGYLEKF